MPKTKQQRLVEDRLWELIEPLLPPRPMPKGPGGRPRVDERAALEGILFVLHTGCRWRDLPPQLGYGSGHTAWRRLRAWQAAGVWDRLHRLVPPANARRSLHRLVQNEAQSASAARSLERAAVRGGRRRVSA